MQNSYKHLFGKCPQNVDPFISPGILNIVGKTRGELEGASGNAEPF